MSISFDLELLFIRLFFRIDVKTSEYGVSYVPYQLRMRYLTAGRMAFTIFSLRDTFFASIEGVNFILKIMILVMPFKVA